MNATIDGSRRKLAAIEHAKKCSGDVRCIGSLDLRGSTGMTHEEAKATRDKLTEQRDSLSEMSKQLEA